MKQKEITKITIWVLFILYCAVMFFLLFVQRLLNSDLTALFADYPRSLEARFEPVPFRTITEFIEKQENFTLYDLSFRNLAGNILLFIPIGVFLPTLFTNQRKYRTFLLTVIVTVCAVELTQMFTLLGSCDIDDLILNTAGASIGYGIYRLFRKLRAKDQKTPD